MRSAGTTGEGNDGAMLFDYGSGVGLKVVQSDTMRISFLAWGHKAQAISGSTSVLNDNLWHHIAFTYTGQTPNDVYSIYVDGNYHTSSYLASGWSWAATQPIEIGTSHNSYWKRYNGFLDDVRFYSRSLTGAEVAQARSGAVVDTNALKLRLDFAAAPAAGYAVTWFPMVATLQTADNVAGPYFDVTNTLSPYAFVPTNAMQFFRTITRQ